VVDVCLRILFAQIKKQRGLIFPEKSIWCSVEQVYQGVSGVAHWEVFGTWHCYTPTHPFCTTENMVLCAPSAALIFQTSQSPPNKYVHEIRFLPFAHHKYYFTCSGLVERNQQYHSIRCFRTIPFKFISPNNYSSFTVR